MNIPLIYRRFRMQKQPKPAPRLLDKSVPPIAAFTLNELLVVMATLGLLVVMVLPTLGSAKATSRQLSCLNNLRQLGIAERLYVVENQQYTGCYSPMRSAYIWPWRLLSYTGGQRDLFACPAAIPSSRWDTNLNSTLTTVTALDGKPDYFGIRSTSRFSYGINDWGVNIQANPQLGLGGDIDGSYGSRPVRDGDVVAPSQMIMMGDTPALANPALIAYAANLDPAVSRSPRPSSSSEAPSNRHLYRTDLVFADGHTETPLRKSVIDPTANNPWRNRWNNDNKPHNEFTWTVNTNTALLDPAY